MLFSKHKSENHAVYFFGAAATLLAVAHRTKVAQRLGLSPLLFWTVTIPSLLVVQRRIARGSYNSAHDNSPFLESPDGSRPASAEGRKVAIVTGTNSGIGYYTALGLAVEGFTIVATCRSAGLAKETAEKLRIEANGRIAKLNAARRKANCTKKKAEPLVLLPEAHIVGEMGLTCDDFASVRAFAEWFQRRFSRLDILVNNAGMMKHRLEFSSYNPQLETHTAVNFLGPLLLTELLIPLIKKCKGRVVHVASEAHSFPPVFLEPKEGILSLLSRVKRLFGRGLVETKEQAVTRRCAQWLEVLEALNQGKEGCSGPLLAESEKMPHARGNASFAFGRYGTSKLLNTYYSHYIVRHHQVTSCSLHPGCVATNFSRDLLWGPIHDLVMASALLFLKTCEDGAQTTLHCCLCSENELAPVSLSSPPHAAGASDLISPYFAECRDGTRTLLRDYAKDAVLGDAMVEWGMRRIGLRG